MYSKIVLDRHAAINKCYIRAGSRLRNNFLRNKTQSHELAYKKKRITAAHPSIRLIKEDANEFYFEQFYYEVFIKSIHKEIT